MSTDEFTLYAIPVQALRRLLCKWKFLFGAAYCFYYYLFEAQQLVVFIDVTGKKMPRHRQQKDRRKGIKVLQWINIDFGNNSKINIGISGNFCFRNE